MGVSLQVYRSRIGGFFSTRFKLSKSSTFSNKSDFFWAEILLAVVFLSSLAVCIQVLQQVHHGHCEAISQGGHGGDLNNDLLNNKLAVPCRLSRRQRNSLAKMVNGNIGARGAGIKLVHWNKGPSFLKNKMDDIETIIANHHPHVLGLSEANLGGDHDLALVQQVDYDLHQCPTINNPIGMSRVVVYTHKSLIVKRRGDLEDLSISAIWLEVGLPNKKKILVCQGYREWKYMGQSDQSSGTVQAQLARWCTFLKLWEQALLEDKEVVVMMDANLDFLKWTKDSLPASDGTARLKPLIDQLFTTIFPHGVSQIVTVPTRSWPGQDDAGLDHIYTNKPDKLSEVHAEFTGGSDHKLLKVTRYSKSLQRSVRYVRKRVFKNFVDKDFKETVQKLSWGDLYSCDDPNRASEIFTDKLTVVLDHMAPLKTIQVRNKYAPWLSDSTKELMKRRNQAQKTASLTKHPDDYRDFKSLRNQTTARMRQERTAWEKRKLSSSMNDPSRLWKNIKSWLAWSNSGPPTRLFHNGRLISSPSGIAGEMNSFFLGKVSRLRANIPASQEDPFLKLREAMLHRQCSFSLSAVEPSEVLKIIKSLKNSKSTGMDNIDTYIVKLIADEIVEPLTYLINLSIQKSVFPSAWKHAKVVPLLKKGDPILAKNYRPVALLPIFSKVVERVVFNQLVQYLDSNNLIHPNHHGSRTGFSTASALIQMYDTWAEEVDKGNMVGVMMVDLSAAFDMVDYSLLLEKLELFGLDRKSVDWMTSYLIGRRQSVMVDGSLSPPLGIECGVPQGSILGPLMYILYTNDIPDLPHNHPVSISHPTPYCHECGGTVSYVDDSTFSFAHSDPEVMSSTLTFQYKVIANYMAANKLKINDDKTHLLVLGTKKMDEKRRRVSMQAGNHTIVSSNQERLLGCMVSTNLKWRNHILDGEQSMVKQLNSRVNALSMISTKGDFSTRLMTANGIIVSKICYLIQLWGGCEGYLIHTLQVLLNKAARLVTRSIGFTSTRKLMAACRWLSVKQLVVYQSTAMVHKTFLSNKPYYMHNRLSTEFSYRTRQQTTGCIRLDQSFRSKGDLPKHSFRCRGTAYYNSIPAEIRASLTMTTFKTKLKRWTRTNIGIE